MESIIEEPKPCEDPEEPKNSLLGIPVLARWPILRMLPSKERKVLRQACISLANEIDDYIGVSNVLSLHDRYPVEALEFLSQSVFNEVKVKRRCYLNYPDIFYEPLKITSFHLLPKGMIRGDFAKNVLLNMKNLKSLVLDGIIEGAISDDCPMPFRSLENFRFENNYPSNEVWERDFMTRQMNLLSKPKILKEDLLDGIIKNQLTLLQNLKAPNCKKVDFNLRLYENRDITAFYDEDELASAIVQFAERNSHLDELLVDVRYRRDEPYLLPLQSSYHRRNEIHTGPKVEIPQAPRSKFKFKSVVFNFHKDDAIIANIVTPQAFPGLSFQTHMLNFLKSLPEVSSLQFASDFGYLNFEDLRQILRTKANALVQIGIKAPFAGPINFGIFTECPSLLNLTLINEDNHFTLLTANQQHSNFPFVTNFGPHYPMMKNLLQLYLCNIRFEEEDLIKLRQFKKLKSLYLHTDLMVHGTHIQNFETYKKLLYIRTLDCMSVKPLSTGGRRVLDVELSYNYFQSRIETKRRKWFENYNKELNVARNFLTWLMTHVNGDNNIVINI